MINLPMDHNFPVPILEAMSPWITETKLIPIRQIDSRLPTLDDRELIIALHQLGYRGLVTNDYNMLKNPGELAAIIATRITVFAVVGLGHDPVRATGAFLLELPSACKAMQSGTRGVFWLRPRDPRPQDPYELFKRAAQQRNQDHRQLYSRVRPSDGELSTPILS